MANSNPQNTYCQYKIRRISWNKKGDIYGITIPRKIAEMHKETKWVIDYLKTPSTSQIILTSGVDLVQLKKEIDKYKLENL